jgi:DNA-directed RNA polymerase specialized sigma24 family protein
MGSPGIDLIRRMARGDRDGFAAFYDAYASLAFGILRRMLPPDEAAEALQDVFWELWRAAGRVRSESREPGGVGHRPRAQPGNRPRALRA